MTDEKRLELAASFLAAMLSKRYKNIEPFASDEDANKYELMQNHMSLEAVRLTYVLEEDLANERMILDTKLKLGI
jgi:hypothetical protein